ncbi:MAG TPA: S-layer homology domain-containing protein [Clostridiales bacterium]|nr:S-layer homology domain-containing protein [Clostridiales bacterium]
MNKKIKLAVILCLITTLLFANIVPVYADSEGTTIINKITTTLSDLINPLLEKLASFKIESVTNAVNKFTDMLTHWSREYVGKLNLLEIIAGYGDGRFGPEDTLKVDEFLKMTLRAMGHKVEEGIDYWAEPYIKLAKEEKIIDEKEFTDYRRPILRQEAARIIVKAALKTEEAPIPNHTSYAKLRIPDYYDIGDDYKQHVLYSYSMGFITGISDGSFLPKKTLTRGEGSAIVMRYLDKGLRKPMKPKDEEIAVITDTYTGVTYEIYPPSKPEVIDVIKVMRDSMGKSKGFPDIGYNATDELVFLSFYKSKEAYEESSIFIDSGIMIYMPEWYLNGYSITIHEPEAVKELHRDVYIELFNHLFEKEADKVIKDFDYCIELGIKGGELKKQYKANNRSVYFTKFEGDKSTGLYVGFKETNN